jgi:MSHA biogenesis protein MshK
MLVMVSASAQQLQDPTRPPQIISQEVGAANTDGPVLQSVLISPGRRMAIISGQQVKLGEQFGSAKLISVSETQVVLRNGGELQTLKLFPDITKRRVPSQTGSNPAIRNNKSQSNKVGS